MGLPTEARLLRPDVAGGSLLLSPKVNEGCGPVKVTIWFFVQVTICNKLPRDTLKTTLTWEKSPLQVVGYESQLNSTSKSGFRILRSFPKSPLKGFGRPLSLPISLRMQVSLRKSSTSDGCKCWVQGREIYTPLVVIPRVQFHLGEMAASRLIGAYLFYGQGIICFPIKLEIH